MDKDALGPLRERIRPVSGHLFLKKGRFEISPSATVSFRDAFFRKYILGTTLTYYPLETLGFGLRAGYALNTVAGSAQMCTFGDEGTALGCRAPTFDELDGQAPGQITLMGGADVQWAPIYGKISLAGRDLRPLRHVRSAGRLGDPVRGPAALSAARSAASRMTGGGNVGLGFRFFLNRYMTLRTELSDLIYVEQAVLPANTAAQPADVRARRLLLPPHRLPRVMNRTLRLLRFALLGLALFWAMPSPAQSFEGLDSTSVQEEEEAWRQDHHVLYQEEARQEGRRRAPPPEPTPVTMPTPAETPTVPAAAADSGSDAVSVSDRGAQPRHGSGRAHATTTPAAQDQGRRVRAGPDRRPAQRHRADDDVRRGGRVRQDGRPPEAGRRPCRSSRTTSTSRPPWPRYEIMKDPKMAGLQLEAQYLLAKSLYRMGMYHSSLGEFSKILAVGPHTKFFKTSLEWLFFISHKTKNETVILDEIARYANSEFPEKFRSEFHYLLARYHFVRGKALDQVGQKDEADKSFDEVQRLTAADPEDGPVLPAGEVPRGPRLLPRRQQVSRRGRRSSDEHGGLIEDMTEVIAARGPRAGRRRSRPAWISPCASWPSCSWRAPTTARSRTATRSSTSARSSAARPSGWRRCSSPPGPTTASASTSRRWAT